MRILVALWALLVAGHATAVEIEKVPLKGGVEAWLVESHSLPMVHVQVSFKAGSVFDPADAHGLASLTAQMITEGSGEDNAQAFAQKLEAVGALMTSNANKLSATTAMRMLAEHKDQSFKLFRQALTQPRFDEVAFKRVQDAVLTGIRAGLQNPSQVASKLRDQYVYDGTAY
ncbi:MAG: insulinase family protein, partial [Pseudomonadota bacterium]|nr:insulinase family protein [Pseudomonadota bacterium]